MRPRPGWLLIALVALVTACSVRKVAYNFADQFIVRAIDGFIDLTPEQRRLVRARLPGHLDWHRQKELPRYVTTLSRLRDQVQAGRVDEAALGQLLDDMDDAIERLAERVAPDAGEVLSTVGPKQADHIRRSFLDVEKERFEDLALSEQDYARARLKRTRKMLKGWIGPLTPAQEELLLSHARARRAMDEVHRDRLRKNGRDLLAVLAGGPPGTSPAALAGLMRSWMTDLEIHPSPEYMKARKDERAAFVRLTLAMHDSLTPAQRGRLVSELDSLRTDLSDLSRR